VVKTYTPQWSTPLRSGVQQCNCANCRLTENLERDVSVDATVCPPAGEVIPFMVKRFSRYHQTVQSLPPGEQDTTQMIARTIVASFRPGCRPIKLVQFEGHADRDAARERREPGFERQISEKRALAVRTAVIAAIGDPAIARQVTMPVVGFGSSRRRVPNPVTEAQRQENRRVEVFLGVSAAPAPRSGPIDRAVVSGFPRYQRSAAALPPAERAKITALARTIVTSFRPGARRVREVRLAGHADRAPAKGAAFERRISGERAQEVQSALVAAINDARITRHIVFRRAGLGATRPVVPSPRTRAEGARNRRVEIQLVPPRHRGLMVLRGNRLVGALTEPSAGSPVAAEAAHETPPSTTIPFNVREDLLHFMDRLHLLWSMNNDDYAKEYALVARQPPRSLIGERLIPRTVAAVVRNREPAIHNKVAEKFLNQPLSRPVGRGQPNLQADVLRLQDSLRALGPLTPADYNRERAAVLLMKDVVDANLIMPMTLMALTELKERIAENRLGWRPFQADELEAGADRFGGRTFELEVITRCYEPKRATPGDPRPMRRLAHTVSIFIPRGVERDASKVHIYFSPRDGAHDSGHNDVLMQGLRASTEGTGWILIGVGGVNEEDGVTKKDTDGFRTMDDAAITACLRWAGRSTDVSAVRLTGHSRGVYGVNETMAGKGIKAPIDRIVVLDEAEVFTQSMRNAIFYRVNDAGRTRKNGDPVRTPPDRTRVLPPRCMRAIGYARIIKNVMATLPFVPIPADILTQLAPLLRDLPERGCFSTQPVSALTGCQQNIVKFCRDHARTIEAVVRNESSDGTRKDRSGRLIPEGVLHFINRDDLDLYRMGWERDKVTGEVVHRDLKPGIASHHLFVAEVAHEFIGR